MSTEPVSLAHAVVAALGGGRRPGGSAAPAWRLDRAAVVDRLHELIADPSRVRQGRMNLCGPAAVFAVWFAHDPVAAATYAVRLFEDGRSSIGSVAVTPSMRLLRLEYGRTERGLTCPQADWMMMAALRDSSNYLVRYSRQGGVREAAAAITMPGAMRRWLGATGLFAEIRDETTLVTRRGMGHAGQVAAGPDREVFLLVAQEMFHARASLASRTRDRVVGLIPNHWVLLRSSITPVDRDRVAFRFWSWGAEHEVAMDRATFRRGYHGCLQARFALRRVAFDA